jgi:hypothetical protein
MSGINPDLRKLPMIPSPDQNEKLERLIHRTLRELPPRRAPRSLEARVLAEIERRALLPWYRKSFAHWPLAAQAGFLAVSAGLVAAVMWLGAGFDPAPLEQAVAAKFAWTQGIAAVANAIGDFFAIMARNIPPLWLYGGLAFIGAMYAAFFGLGAAAYRTLYATR